MYIYYISSGGADRSSRIYSISSGGDRQVITYIYSISSGGTDKSSRIYTLLAVAGQTGHHVYIPY